MRITTRLHARVGKTRLRDGKGPDEPAPLPRALHIEGEDFAHRFENSRGGQVTLSNIYPFLDQLGGEARAIAMQHFRMKLDVETKCMQRLSQPRIARSSDSCGK